MQFDKVNCVGEFDHQLKVYVLTFQHFLPLAPSFKVGGIANYTFLESSWPDK